MEVYDSVPDSGLYIKANSCCMILGFHFGITLIRRKKRDVGLMARVAHGLVKSLDG